jgi:crotonobetainyl-CoA:carnitine CoA-transferase CaiB-like acyl-CoA transferase
MALLESVRVLDLTDGRGLLAGRILADLGADVVHVEPPEGSSARRSGPLSTSGSSFLWEAFAANERSIAVDPTDTAGQSELRHLITEADIFIESSGPVVMNSLGLGYEELIQLNPRLVYVSLTAFGRSGPKAGYMASDLVLWAAGGPLEPHREGNRPPVRPSVPQAYRLAASDAASGALIALRSRDQTGRGQLVDVSVQAALGSATIGMVLTDAVGDVPKDFMQGKSLATAPKADRSGSGSGSPAASKKWRAKDGMVELNLAIGPATGKFTNSLFRWMESEGEPVKEFINVDWRTADRSIEDGIMTPEQVTRARGLVADFIAKKTKAEMLTGALTHKIVGVPIYMTSDLINSPQLAARGFYDTVGTGDRLRTVPGAPARMTPEQPKATRPAPLIGEHTDEVLLDWCGNHDTNSHDTGDAA